MYEVPATYDEFAGIRHATRSSHLGICAQMLSGGDDPFDHCYRRCSIVPGDVGANLAQVAFGTRRPHEVH